MEKIISSIENSLQNENWYSALVLSLIVPDICGKLEGQLSSQKRYSVWFNKYLGKKYSGYLSGDDCYAFRCSCLHEGSNNIERQRARDILDNFIFISNGSHRIRISKCSFGSPKYDGKEVLQLSVSNLCLDVIEATKKWLIDVADNQNVQKNITEMLEIHEKEFSVGNALRIS